MGTFPEVWIGVGYTAGAVVDAVGVYQKSIFAVFKANLKVVFKPGLR
jgi:hypothetical protein